MPRCSQCNKFVSLEEEEPEEQGLDIGTDGTITASYEIINSCSECSNQLRSATIDLEVEPSKEIEEHLKIELPEGKQHELEVEANAERDQKTSGKGRGLRTFYGVRANFTVKCSCDPEFEHETDAEDYVQASGMDELD
jgi:hypothetical protein